MTENGWGRFCQLFDTLHGTNRTEQKVVAIEEYFRHVDDADAAWALWFLTGNKFPRPIRSTDLRRLVGRLAQIPEELVAECHEAVGDLAETMALLVGPSGSPSGSPFQSLVDIIEQVVRPLQGAPLARQTRILTEAWGALSTSQRLLLNKLILGNFRMGVARTLAIRGLSRALDLPVPLLTERLMGHWEPTPEFYRTLSASGAGSDPSGNPSGNLAPYPFFLAHPLEQPPEELGPPEDWLVEWKWDGIRAQLVRRRGETAIWTRGEELATRRFPELAEAGAHLPDGTVLDGEILAWNFARNEPAPFAVLQPRINSDRPMAATIRQAPVVLLAYDLLEMYGQDWRQKPIEFRLEQLQRCIADLPPDSAIRYHGPVDAATWQERQALWDDARKRCMEGLMIKRRGSAYGMGRVRGDWWKWKVAPLTVDAVLIHAMAGHGKRASLYTDYTFGLHKDGELVPVARAYSGLTDSEIRELDKWIRQHTIARRGAFRTVEPVMVMELGFDSVQRSTRHKSGLAVRFPRILRWRKDKPVSEADKIEVLEAMVREPVSAKLTLAKAKPTTIQEDFFSQQSDKDGGN
jgi:DNA ligase-1